MQESMVKGEVLCQHPLAFETTYYLQVWLLMFLGSPSA